MRGGGEEIGKERGRERERGDEGDLKERERKECVGVTSGIWKVRVRVLLRLNKSRMGERESE